ncbi:MAG: flavodoxin family protein [Nitrospirae bacterium]|nr:flavodoxin family protein [Nitrospirota bacterium]
MSVKIAAFLGSPRKNGNTELLANAAASGARDAGAEVETFRLADMSIAPCKSCGGCGKTGRCVFQDDAIRIHDAIRNADRIILASPIYFFALSAQTKAMIDRCQAFWCEKYLLKKPVPPGPAGRKGLLLLVGAYAKSDEGICCAEVCAKAFFNTVSVSDHRRLSYIGIDGAGTIREHPTALAEAYEAGVNLTKSDGYVK